MKRSKLRIKCFDAEDAQASPHCPHGPMLLFYTDEAGEANGYYACSAHRDKQSCNFRLLASNWQKGQTTDKKYHAPLETLKDMRNKLTCSAASLSDMCYCHTCNVVFLKAQLSEHSAHDLETTLTAKKLKDPTCFLRPLSLDKSQAQYFFDSKALRYFEKCFHKLRISKVICIGAPRMHTYLRARTKQQSFLLDFDLRFQYFLGDDEYAWYNMCNNWFFDQQQKAKFQQFLKCEFAERLLIFTDPPFGCRTEPIASTLRQLTKFYNKINQLPHQPLPIFWIFPYYAEHYIRAEMSEMDMCDYMVNYTNHDNYTDIGKHSRAQGSPVRIFTNIPLQMLPLPQEGQYTFCAACERFVFRNNKHCQLCGICPSKNGGVYKHCAQCGKCVKTNYQHCQDCRRCVQVNGHNCAEYQANQFCWICLKCGHTEYNCEEWQLLCKRKGLKRNGVRQAKRIICLICGKAGHNERYCQKRYEYIEEFSFLGKTEMKFKH